MIEDYLRFRWVTQESDKDATGDDDNNCLSGLIDEELADEELKPCECPDCGDIDLEENDTDETLCNI